jgi:hypothetical protein
MASNKKTKATHYLAMWDMLGLESLFNITALQKEHAIWEKKKIWQQLKEEQFRDSEPTIPLNMMILRARFNSQRCYEIYEFNSTLSEKELRAEFESNPQPIVNWIRENGYKVYSDYVKSDRKLIA